MAGHLIHDLTNRLHTVTMELELAKAGVNKHADISRLLIEMHSMRDSVEGLRDCIQPAKQSLAREISAIQC